MISFTFLSPERLVLLVLPLALAVLLFLRDKKPSAAAVSFSSVDMLRGLVQRPRRWKRVTPPVLVLAAMAMGVVAAAQPAREVADESSKSVVVLTIDVSLSMSATDVAPSRIEVAKDAAIRFVENAPENTLIGVVAFDSVARQVISATENRSAVTRVIESLQPGTGTAIGEAIFASIDTVNSAAAESGLDSGDSGEIATGGTIILLSDGTTTIGRPDSEAAAAAQAEGIVIHTIAFGTESGTVVTPDGQTVPVPPDEQALRNIADIARGESYTATTAEALRDIYDSLGATVVRATVIDEVGDLFAVVAILLLFAGSLMSLLWFRRLV
jgi:Ca-activated chloride channel family protein